MMSRRNFLSCAGYGALGLAGAGVFGAWPARAGEGERPNILLITADDMNYNSPGFQGCRVPEITPNLDRLRSEGLLFRQAHVTAAICQPSRQALMTGRYPHSNSRGGFDPIRDDIPTLQESLRAGGYFNGILAKVPHLAPQPRFCWDMVVPADLLGGGRDPQRYYRHTTEFLAAAKAAGKPFFLMANSQDPHRPFAGSQGDPYPPARKQFRPEEIEVPGFLPDLPDVRRELAQYFTSVHRCDETVGEVLRALKESGLEEKTLVMFLSDNGMAFPFAKTNCYLTSTRTPWIVRWPGKVKPGATDDRHLINGIDFTPTVLEAAGLPAIPNLDGRSFLPLALGREQAGRDYAYTEINATSAGTPYPMRCVQGRRFGYIYNGWADGKLIFRNESQAGLTWRAMVNAAATDPKVAERVELFQHRVPEELFDLEKDPDALHNLIDDPAYKDEAARMRKLLLANLQAAKDPVLPAFRRMIGD